MLIELADRFVWIRVSQSDYLWDIRRQSALGNDWQDEGIPTPTGPSSQDKELVGIAPQLAA